MFSAIFVCLEDIVAEDELNIGNEDAFFVYLERRCVSSRINYRVSTFFTSADCLSGHGRQKKNDEAAELSGELDPLNFRIFSVVGFTFCVVLRIKKETAARKTTESG